MPDHRNVIPFAEDLAILLDSGSDLYTALTALLETNADDKFKPVLESLQADIQTGQNLSSAMLAFPGVFDSFCVGMVKSGEVSGQLGKTLSRLAEQLENQRELRHQISTALIYPAILLIAMFLSLVLVVGLILPQLTTLFESIEGQLSTAARVSLASGQFISSWGLWIAGALALLATGSWLFRASLQPKARLQFLIKRIPVIRSMLDSMDFARFTSTLSSLLESGLAQTDALLIARDSMSDTHNQQQLSLVIERVKEGQSLGDCLAQVGGVGQLYAHTIRNGERGGKLPETLRLLSARLEKEFARKAQRAVSLIEPIIIIVLGLVVGAIIYAVFSSLQSLGDLPL